MLILHKNRRDGSDEGSQHTVLMRNKNNYHHMLPLIQSSDDVNERFCGKSYILLANKYSSVLANKHRSVFTIGHSVSIILTCLDIDRKINLLTGIDYRISLVKRQSFSSQSDPNKLHPL